MRVKRVSGAAVLLLVVLIFQSTALPDTLGVHAIARAANFIALATFFAVALRAFMRGTMRKLPPLYLVPVVLVLVGYAINIFRSLSLETLGYAAGFLSWLAALSVPFMKSYSLEESWKLFFRFMVLFSAVALIEFVALFAGQLSPSLIVTDRGEFLKGIVTLFHGLDDGTVYYKMYGVFPEPGTFAMLLIPAFAYALVFVKPWAFALFAVCLYFTTSLGGAFSIGVLLLFYGLRRTRGNIVAPFAVVIAAGIAGYFLYPFFAQWYASKGASATIRESNVSLFLAGFLTILQQHPFGLPLVGRSLTDIQNVSAAYIGSDFEPYTVFVKGGVLALVGYAAFFTWVAVRSIRFVIAGDRDKHLTCALISLPPLLIFVWQRDTILSSALFAFLFAVPLMTFSRARSRELAQASGAPGAAVSSAIDTTEEPV